MFVISCPEPFILIALIFPFTSKFSLGNIVLIPISPASLINNTEEFSFFISKILLFPNWEIDTAVSVPLFVIFKTSVFVTSVFVVIKLPTTLKLPPTVKLLSIYAFPSTSNFSVVYTFVFNIVSYI